MKPIYIGNVHEVYNISERQLVIVSTDRMSVHGKTIPMPIKDKGIILTEISNFWFNLTKDIIPNHLLETRNDHMPCFFHDKRFYRRTVLVKKLKIIPYEFIVRGYMYGRLWDNYSEGKDLCGVHLSNPNYQLASKLDSPIITPTIKLDHARDKNTNLSEVSAKLGSNVTDYLCNVSLSLYKRCSEIAKKKGIIIADTKFEFGIDEQNEILLADEIFTPDSSRFWDAATYQVGQSPKSFDKQLIRDWLSNNKKGNEFQYDKIPREIIERTEEIYASCHKRLLTDGQ